MRHSKVRSLALALLVIGCPACTCCKKDTANQVPLPDATLAAPFASCVGASSSAGSVKPPTVSARILTDITPTMQGFAGFGAKATALRQVHSTIDVAAGEATAPGPKRCSIGARWECRKLQEGDKTKCVEWVTTPAVMCDAKAPDYGTPSTYSATTETSKLDEILVRKPIPEKVDPDHPVAPDWLDEAGLTVIVSSGIEPGPLSTGAATTAREACQAGPSPACVAKALVERVKEGFGVWAATVMLPFDGSYVADVPVDAKYLAATKAHLEGLKKVAAGEATLFQGVEFTAGVQAAVYSRGANHSRFLYKGLRPLLVLALSRSPETGRAFLRSLREKLQADPALRPGKMAFDDVFAASELAPLASTTYALKNLELAPAGAGGQGDLDPAALAEFHLGAPGASANGAWAEISCGGQGKAWALAKYEAKAPAIPLPVFIKESTQLQGPSSNETLPDRSSTAQNAPGGEPAFRIFTTCAPLAPRANPWVIEYLFHAKSELDESMMGGQWFAKGSAPNSYEMPERLYGLREIATAVLRQTVIHERCVQKVRLSVKRTP